MKRADQSQLAHRCASCAQHGFTLIELMVGLVIGLVATIVIAQVLVRSESARRSTVSGSDAQVSGALALYTLQRDVTMAGYGISSALAGLGCPVANSYNNAAVAGLIPTLAPVVITDGGAGVPATIGVVNSGKASYSVPVAVTSTANPIDTFFTVTSTLGTAVGDLMVAVPRTIDVNNWCSLFNVTGLNGAGQIRHVSGVGGAWNPAASIFPAAGYQAPGSYLINLGSFVQRTYSISGNGTLQVTTIDSANPTVPTTQDLVTDVVNMQALYGKDTNNDGVVDTYDTVTPTTNAGWQQVLSVRIAVVARSTQREKAAEGNATAANPLWDLGSTTTVTTNPAALTVPCGTHTCVTLKVDTLPDWQQYRYKVYDTIVPLRNLLWRS